VIQRWRSMEAVLLQAVSLPGLRRKVGDLLSQVANVPKAFGAALALGLETERLACKVLRLTPLRRG